MAASDRPMTTIVEFQIRPESNTMDEWISEWDLRARDAADGEPETSAYAAGVNLEQPLNVLVYERYTNGQSSLQTHMDRPAHQALMDAMSERNMNKRFVTSVQFDDVADYGWWSRPERADRNSAPGNILVILGMRFKDLAMRETFLRLSSEHAEYCAREEPDTLIYSAGLATSPTDREIDVAVDDLIFVMGCSDMAAVEKHSQDPNHLALGERFAEAGVDIESTFMRTYRTAGNGFLWRD